MIMEDGHIANSCFALACDDEEVDDDAKSQTMNDADDQYFEEILVGDQLTLPKMAQEFS